MTDDLVPGSGAVVQAGPPGRAATEQALEALYAGASAPANRSTAAMPNCQVRADPRAAELGRWVRLPDRVDRLGCRPPAGPTRTRRIQLVDYWSTTAY